MIRRVGIESGELELAIVGAGYVGLVMAASLTTLGFAVHLIDRDVNRIANLRSGRLPFFEPGLDDAVRECAAIGRLKFATSLAAARQASAVFVAVGTLDQRGEWSSREVNRAVSDIAADPDSPRTVIVRSTLMPGSTRRLLKLAADRDADVEIALNPEFTRQGTAVADFMHPDRVVIGLTRPAGESRALPILERIYARVDAPRVVTDATTAELIKVGSNAFLALKAGFANELDRVAAAMGADIATVVDGIGLDGRIGRSFLTPGPGFGGSCLPSQSRSLPAMAAERGISTPILDAVDGSNSAQAEWVVDEIERMVGAIDGKRVCVLGLTFKAATDDVRESPALRVCSVLARRGATVIGHDPLGAVAARAFAHRAQVALEVVDNVDDAVRAADAVVVTTEWPLYGDLDWESLASTMTGRHVLDVRGVVDAQRAASAGLNIRVHGRPAN